MASSAEALHGATSPLAERVAVVTGGSRGIGAAVVRALAAAGARTYAVARGGDALRDLARECGAEAVVADVGSDEGLRDLADRLGERGPDIVVHSAGAFGLADLVDTEVEAFDRMIAVNLRAAFVLARMWLPGMLKRESGHFVSIGSVAGRQALAGNTAYAASKFGLRGLHAVLDLELAGTGVRATLIEPSATATELWDEVAGAGYDLPPRESMLDPGAVADAVVYALTRAQGVRIPNLLIGRG